MKIKPFKEVLLGALLCVISASSVAQTEYWPRVNKESKPWTRWWWMGDAADEKNVSSLLGSYHAAGFGGVEIAPIYGAKGYESRYIPYLSDQWTSILRYTVNKANALGMGVDLTNGTGWPFGGPQVDVSHAATRLYSKEFQLDGGQRLLEKVLIADVKGPVVLQALLAVGDKGQRLQLGDKVNSDGSLDWTAPAGNWQLYALFTGRTGQKVKRAAPGGEGFTLNHFSGKALDRYLSRYDQAFSSGMPPLRAFYNDSYEVYGADWSDDFFAEFGKRRGYLLQNYLKEFFSGEATDQVARVKSDYRLTMAELIQENFTRRWTDWAHNKKALTKNQAHGSPGNLLDLYATVDIPEGETFGSTHFDIGGIRRDSADIRNVDPDPVMLKFASSAAHVSGHPYASNETFTWLTEHFKTALSQTKPEIENVFLSGINHVFFHGVTYSPSDVAWPGWLFYASVNFVPANSWWSQLPALNNYITRVQSVLQAGKPDNELLIYWPVYDVWNNPKGRDMALKVHDIDEWLHPSSFYKNVKKLQEAGYSLDFISDKQIGASTVAAGMINTSAGSGKYKTLIVPACSRMPAATLKSIIRLADAGARIIFESLPEDVPGLSDLEKERAAFKALKAEAQGRMIKQGGKLIVSSDLKSGLASEGVLPEKLVESGLQFIRRAGADATYYYLVNHTARDIDEYIPLNTTGKRVLILDPQSGKAGLAACKESAGRLNTRVQIRSGESLILKISGSSQGEPLWVYVNKTLPAIDLTGPWTLKFESGGPVLPKERTLTKLQNWTDLGDEQADNFSGTASYSSTFRLPALKAKDYMLKIEGLHESARVWINGRDAGFLWSVPFSMRLGSLVRPGLNTIRIEVANLMANRVRYMDKQGIQWRNYHEINFVNINYKNFDASGWEVMPSGISGSVKIIPFR